MNKIKWLLFFVCSTAVLKAQPVITSLNYYTIGDSSLIYLKYDTSLLSLPVGASGANVTWDFSVVDFNHPSVIIDTCFYIDPVNTPFFTNATVNYSLSDLCMLRKTDPFSPGNNDYNYYLSNNDSVSFIGHWANNGGSELGEDHCTDFIKQLKFPFTYQSSFTDSFTRLYNDFSGSGYHYQDGSNIVSADGYGTLILPGGITLANAVRIHSILMVRDSGMFGISNQAHHNYSWYCADKKGFILSMNMSLNDSIVIESIEYQKQTNIISAVENIKNDDTGYFIYPNPVSDKLYIKKNNSNYKSVKSIDVFSINGAFTKEESLTGTENYISTKLLPKGIYFIRIITDKDSEVLRFIKN